MQIAWCIGNQDERTGISWATISVKLNQSAVAADGTIIRFGLNFFPRRWHSRPMAANAQARCFFKS